MSSNQGGSSVLDGEDSRAFGPPHPVAKPASIKKRAKLRAVQTKLPPLLSVLLWHADARPVERAVRRRKFSHFNRLIDRYVHNHRRTPLPRRCHGSEVPKQIAARSFGRKASQHSCHRAA